MPWGRLDDSLYDHPKLDLIAVEDRLAAIGLWARAISWANRFLTDGLVPRDRIAKLDGTGVLADQLVVAGLFEDVPNGYLIHDFLEFNDSRQTVLERRAKDAARKAAYRASKVRPTGTDGGTKGGTKEPVTHDVPAGRTAGQPRKRLNVSHGLSQRPSRRDSRTRNPDPTRPIGITPKSPPDGGDHDGSTAPGRRSEGTNPRAIAAQLQAAADDARRAVAWRRNQRQLAYLRGAIGEAERQAMDDTDAALSEIPGYTEHMARLKAEQDAPPPIEADVEAWVS